jgi:hypothetical protein
MTTLKSTFRQGQDSFLGAQPSMWYGDAVPDGDAYPWKDAALGSTYVYQTSALSICYQKQATNDADADWVPGTWVGSTALDGSAAPFSTAPVGSVYHYVSSGITIKYTKMADNDDSANWYGEGCIYNLGVAYDDLTDGGAAVGTLVMTADIPAGATATKSVVRNVVGWAGDTSAVLTIGDGTDADRYNTGTPSIFANAAIVDMGAVSGTALHTSAVTTPTLTVTSGSDYGAVSAGSLDVYIYFNVVA